MTPLSKQIFFQLPFLIFVFRIYRTGDELYYYFEDCHSMNSAEKRFDKGEKIILENFEEIFSTVGMDYMNT